MPKTRRAYKLFRVRKDGSIGSLFINARARYEPGQWMHAEEHRKSGFQFRPGWHAMKSPQAPHLTIKGRAWYLVEISNYTEETRPASQGGAWFLSQRLRILRPLNQQELKQTINHG